MLSSCYNEGLLLNPCCENSYHPNDTTLQKEPNLLLDEYFCLLAYKYFYLLFHADFLGWLVWDDVQIRQCLKKVNCFYKNINSVFVSTRKLWTTETAGNNQPENLSQNSFIFGLSSFFTCILTRIFMQTLFTKNLQPLKNSFEKRNMSCNLGT